MIIFGELNIKRLFLADFHTYHLFLKAGDKTARSDFKRLIFGCAAVKLNAVNTAGVVKAYRIAVFNRTVIDIDKAGSVVLCVLDFVVNFLVGYIILNRVKFYTLIFAQFNFRHKGNCNFALNNTVIGDIVKFDFGTVNGRNTVFFYGSLINRRENFIKSVFKKDSGAVELFNHTHRRFTFAETGNGIFALCSLEHIFRSLVNSLFAYFKVYHCLIFFIFNHSTHYLFTSK